MRSRSTPLRRLVLLSGIGVCSLCWVGPDAGGEGRPSTAEEVARLIAKLGSQEFQDREAAGKALLAIGEPALEPLREAARGHPDLEVKRRAERLAELIAEQVGKASLVRRYQGPPVAVSAMTFSPDGQKVLSYSGGAYAGEKEEMVDRTLRLWEWKAGKELLCMRGHPARVGEVSFSPDGRLALSCGFEAKEVDTTIRVWSLETGKELRHLTGHGFPVYSARFSPDGRHILSTSSDQTARLWDAETGKELRRMGQATRPRALFSPDGRHVLATSGAAVHLYETESGKQVRQFGGDEWFFPELIFSPDGKRVVISTSKRPRPGAAEVGCVELWDVEGKLIRTFDGHLDMVIRTAFSPDGKRLLSADRKADVRLWDVETGKELRRFKSHTPIVLALAFTADGKQALTGHTDNSITVWDLPKER